MGLWVVVWVAFLPWEKLQGEALVVRNDPGLHQSVWFSLGFSQAR